MILSSNVRGVKVYSFIGFNQIMDYAISEKKILIALNSDKLYYSDPKLRIIINSNIGYCDGIGAVWALRRKGIRQTVKIPGCELWLKFIENFPNKKFYLIGAQEDVIINTVSKLKKDFPNVNIVGFRNGYIKTKNEESELILSIQNSSPDFVFIAMGSPKQEYLLNEIYKEYPTTMMGLGGSFDVFSGSVKRAPQWMIKLNLETLFRYIFANISFSRMICDFKFLFLLILNRL